METINKNTNIAYVWNKMRVLKNSSKTIEWTRWQEKDRAQECLKVMNEISPPWVQEKRWVLEANTQESNRELNEGITREEIIRAVKCRKMNSAPGPDHIEYGMIKRMNSEFMEILTYIFNECVKTGKYPVQWKEHQVIFIDKPGKEKVRPITLSSCMGKILERMITERINWWAERNGIVNKKQNGFRKGRLAWIT